MKLTQTEQIFAERNHGLVSEYLKQRRLSWDEYYDVVIFGYLESIQDYLKYGELWRYSFKEVAFKSMDTAINGYRRKNKDGYRAVAVLSLNYPMNDSGTLTFQDMLVDTSCDICDEICEKQMFEDLFQSMNRPCRDVLTLKVSGYSTREIAQKYALSVTEVKKRFDEIKGIMRLLETAA